MLESAGGVRGAGPERGRGAGRPPATSDPGRARGRGRRGETARVLARRGGGRRRGRGRRRSRSTTATRRSATWSPRSRIGGPLAVAARVAARLRCWPPPGCARRGDAPPRAARSRCAAAASGCRCPRAHDEIRRLGETLNEMLDRLRRSFERERRFVADASHELRTPIAVVKTELEGALRTGDYDPRRARGARRRGRGVRPPGAARRGPARHRALGRGRAAGAAGARRRARAARGRARPLRRPRRPARARDRVDADDGLRVYADPLRLRQALGNLVDNALRHGAGEIVLRGAPRRRAASSSRSPTRAPGFAPELAATRVRALHARRPRPARAAAPASGWRSCAPSPRPTAASAEIVPRPGATVRLSFPDVDPRLRAHSGSSHERRTLPLGPQRQGAR